MKRTQNLLGLATEAAVHSYSMNKLTDPAGRALLARSPLLRFKI